jgi:hypothetical protein
MATQKELLRQHRKGLSEQFKEKFPNGRFTLHIREIAHNGKIIHELAHVTTRPTSWTHPFGKVVEQVNGGPVTSLTHQNNSIGTCRHYDSLEKLVKSARNSGLSEEIIQAFIQKFQVV